MTDDDGGAPHVDKWPTDPDPDQAWKSLSLVNDWIRHGDAKLGVTLAFTGASAALLVNLLKDKACLSVGLAVISAIAGVCLVVSAACAVVGLIPQVRVAGRREPEAHTNMLFYRHIAKGWKDRRSVFIFELGSMTMDKQKMTRHIGEQVHANAVVATRKYVWADRAIKWLAGGWFVLAIVAIVAI